MRNFLQKNSRSFTQLLWCFHISHECFDPVPATQIVGICIQKLCICTQLHIDQHFANFLSGQLLIQRVRQKFLLDRAKPSKKKPSPADTGSLFLLPASKLANYMAASAWSFLDIKRSLFAQHRFGDLETALAKRWIGNFLCCGEVFNIRGRYSLSLGFFGYAAQMRQLNHLEVGEDMYFSLKARRGRRLLTCMFCKQPNQTA